ncbi:MAG: hypothetical protein IJU76_00245, partial [Desulfovibrionaceae bacterium]|nr:hypothetical protein [Desulfovibrionaceae bacterium]
MSMPIPNLLLYGTSYPAQGNRFYFFLKNIKNNTYIESKKIFYNELENKISKFPESISAKSDSEFLEKFTSLFTPYTLFKLELIREKT